MLPSCRLIPAHAGKTVGALDARSRCRAHPRSRGENWLLVGVWCSGWGSSPLTRGKPGVSVDGDGVLGLIPAHAGKTGGERARRDCRWAHPRSRGENAHLNATKHADHGSSPLTRGKRHRERVCLQVPGLIPAHAGKTRSATSLRRARTAHPRSRGENAAVFLGTAWTVGSSPLTRGKPLTTWPANGLSRLIPAHAGKTVRGFVGGDQGRAHPRSRGENCAWRSAISDIWGSSPLTRGKPDD